MKLFTIGFTQKTAECFFETLRASGAQRVVDVRLHNTSQLAGFAKQQDLAYFLQIICGMEYVHLPILSPTPQLFDGYKKDGCPWQVYEQQFLALMQERRVQEQAPR